MHKKTPLAGLALSALCLAAAAQAAQAAVSESFYVQAAKWLCSAMSADAAAGGSRCLLVARWFCPAPDSHAAASGAPTPQSEAEAKSRYAFKMLDFDGKLGSDEIASMPRLSKVFDEVDADRDGFVDYEELQAFGDKRRVERERSREQ